jgi:RNA polymerase sigma factor (sigma-70 family)
MREVVQVDPAGSRQERVRRFERLYEELAPDVHAYVLRRVGQELVPDVVADVFVVAWRRLDDLPSPALPWLLGVARKTVANHLRSARRRTAVVERLRAAASAATVDPSHAERVWIALASLGERDREALMLVAWEGLSRKEAADVLGCSSAAFRVRLHRARARLGRALEGSATGSSSRPPTLKSTAESLE